MRNIKEEQNLKNLERSKEMLKAIEKVMDTAYDLRTILSGLIGGEYRIPSHLESQVVNWALERGIHTSTPQHQTLKLFEEVGELAGAIAKDDREEIIDAMGDIQVVLIILAMLLGLGLQECLESAYDVIKDRKGQMVNGVWIKEEDLEPVPEDENILNVPLTKEHMVEAIRNYDESKSVLPKPIEDPQPGDEVVINTFARHYHQQLHMQVLVGEKYIIESIMEGGPYATLHNSPYIWDIRCLTKAE